MLKKQCIVFRNITLVALSTLYLAGCSSTSTSYQQDNDFAAGLPEQAESIEQPVVKDIDLYVGRPLEPWRMYIRNFEQEQFLSGTFTQLQDETITARTLDKDVQEDALQLTFQNHWNTGLYISDGVVDLSEHLKQGTLELDIRVDAIQKGTADILVDCSVNCRKAFQMRDWALEHEGQGWQHLSIPLACLLDDKADVTAIRRPFELRTGGNGQLAIANVRFTVEGQPNMACPEKLSTTPDTLHEYWAVDWWLPRHESKVAQAEKGTAELLMIGDSITHGWEDKGKAVWEEHFADVDTLNLGFGGDRTENVLWRLQHGTLGNTQPKLAVIMIGTNNTGHRLDTPEDIRDGVGAILDELKAQVPDTKVLLLAIFPRSETPDDALRQNNEATNQLLQTLAEQRGIMFDNFNSAFLQEDGILTREIMPDLLHPEHDGYEIWASKLTPYIGEYVRGK